MASSLAASSRAVALQPANPRSSHRAVSARAAAAAAPPMATANSSSRPTLDWALVAVRGVQHLVAPGDSLALSADDCQVKPGGLLRFPNVLASRTKDGQLRKGPALVEAKVEDEFAPPAGRAGLLRRVRIVRIADVQQQPEQEDASQQQNASMQ